MAEAPEDTLPTTEQDSTSKEASQQPAEQAATSVQRKSRKGLWLTLSGIGVLLLLLLLVSPQLIERWHLFEKKSVMPSEQVTTSTNHTAMTTAKPAPTTSTTRQPEATQAEASAPPAFAQDASPLTGEAKQIQPTQKEAPPIPVTANPVSVDTPPVPNDLYAQSSLAAEQRIMQLQHQLTALRDEQAQWQQQRSQLQTQLQAQSEQHQQWLQSHQARQLAMLDQLPFAAAAWQELALSPLLHESQRQQALRNADLASNYSQQRQHWLQQLQQAVVALNVDQPANIIPEEQWWQRWLAQQISVRRAPDEASLHQRDLQQQVRTVYESLQQQHWPDESTWHTIWQELKGRGMAENLPESLAAAKQTVITLQQQAQQWQEAQQ